MKCLRVLAAAVFLVSSAPAFAQFYAFAGAGGGNPKFDGGDFPGGGGILRRNDTKDVTYHVGVGYRFNANWAVELGAADMGDYSIDLSDFLGNALVGTYKVQGFKTAVVGSWPFTERFSMFVKLGLASTKAEFEGTSVAAGVPTQFTVDERRNSLLAGFGAQYNITRNIGIRGEFENWGEVGNNKAFPLDTTRTGKAKMATWNLLGVFSF